MLKNLITNRRKYPRPITTCYELELMKSIPPDFVVSEKESIKTSQQFSLTNFALGKNQAIHGEIETNPSILLVHRELPIAESQHIRFCGSTIPQRSGLRSTFTHRPRGVYAEGGSVHCTATILRWANGM